MLFRSGLASKSSEGRSRPLAVTSEVQRGTRCRAWGRSAVSQNRQLQGIDESGVGKDAHKSNPWAFCLCHCASRHSHLLEGAPAASVPGHLSPGTRLPSCSPSWSFGVCVSAKDHQRAAEGAGQTSLRPKARPPEALRSLRAPLTGAVSAAATPAAHPRAFGESLRGILLSPQ